MGQLMPVRFLRRYDLYNAGEIAGVPPDVATQLIASGRAVAYDAAAVEPEPEQAPTVTTPAKGKRTR